jgi:uncharacterized membrane protein
MAFSLFLVEAGIVVEASVPAELHSHDGFSNTPTRYSVKCVRGLE